jgi:hypothetical protein
VSTDEFDAMLGAGNLELAASGAERVEPESPVDVDPGRSQLVADHAHVEPNIVAGNYGPVDPCSYMLSHVGESRCITQHPGV